jgi:DNA processing protein
MPPSPPDPALRDLLRLTLTPGLGPILIARLLERFGSPDRILAASAAQLEQIRGIGAGKSVAFVKGLKDSASLVDDELALAEKLGVHIIPKDSPEYPPLLRTIPDAPPLLYIRGHLHPATADRYPVAIVGSRRGTAYGIEQAERFGGILARAGLTIVSGGARGIDTAAHRGAMRSGGRTVAILGCGLAECYPPENREFFEKMVAAGEGSEGGGALVSELPLRTHPESDNFPARNRLISGMSLGVIVIEAGRKSGSLITARVALEDQNREVMAVPGRVDSASSQGTHELIKQHGAALVTDPGDVLEILETPARHSFQGSHEARYADPTRAAAGSLFDDGAGSSTTASEPPGPVAAAVEGKGGLLTPVQQSILRALSEPRSLDDVARDTGLSPGELRVEVTMLELQRRITRRGTFLAKI